jgi:hypothetical protein
MHKRTLYFFLSFLAAQILISKRSLAETVLIHPGESIQAHVNRTPAGTTFIIKSGIHRLQQVQPKDGNTFLGEPGATMSGARLLTDFRKEGGYWVATGQTQRGQVHGLCHKNADGSRYEGCKYPEDLFFDDKPLWHVRSRSDLRPGTWHFDYTATKIYLADDPTGRTVESSISRFAFAGAAREVTIRNLVIEKYAAPAQFGAVEGSRGSGWVVDRNEIRLNHGAGIRTGPQMKITGNKILNNGQLGIGGGGDGVLVEGNEIAYNNYAGFSSGWEGGGSKWVKTRNLVVRQNRVYRNKGPGLWTDGDNIDTTYESNQVVENKGAGIFHEISLDAVIRNNRVARNGVGSDPWLYGAQILISSSKNVRVHDNVVEIAAEGGNGIAIIQQKRGGGKYGPHVAIGNYVHHNDIVYLGNKGMSGAAADYEPEAMYNGNNLFDYNTYRAPRLDRSRWAWRGNKSWEGFRMQGQEPNGRADTSNKSDSNP